MIYLKMSYRIEPSSHSMIIMLPIKERKVKGQGVRKRFWFFKISPKI